MSPELVTEPGQITERSNDRDGSLKIDLSARRMFKFYKHQKERYEKSGMQDEVEFFERRIEWIKMVHAIK